MKKKKITSEMFRAIVVWFDQNGKCLFADDDTTCCPECHRLVELKPGKGRFGKPSCPWNDLPRYVLTRRAAKLLRDNL